MVSMGVGGGGLGAGPGANPMSFAENQHGSVLLEKLREQRLAGRFCDVVLVVEGKRFPAHRNILAAGSPYLDSILKQHKECEAAVQVVKEEVRVNCGNAESFGLLLDYLYSGSVVLNASNVLHLLRLANNFLVSKLKNYCAEYLDRYLDATNVLTVRELASKYNMPGLGKNAAAFLDTNLGRVAAAAAQPLDWSLPRLQTWLREHPVPPGPALELCLRWLGQRPAERGEKLAQLLSTAVQVELVEAERLERALISDPGLAASHAARFALLQAMAAAGLPLESAQGEYQALLHRRAQGHQPADIHLTSSAAPSQDIVGEESSSVVFETSVEEAGPSHSRHSTNGSPDDAALPMENGSTLGPSTSLGGAERAEDSDSRDSTALRVRVKLEAEEESSGPEQGFFERMRADEARRDSPVPIRTIPLINGVPTDVEAATQSPRPPLKLTLKVPLMTRKAKLLGARRKTAAVEAASAIVAKRRGRPPKARLERIVGTPAIALAQDAPDAPVYLPETPGEEGAKVLYRCPWCVYTSVCGSRISAHMEKAHARDRSFDCGLCEFSCRWNREYYAHMKTHFPGPPFACDSCPYAADRIQMLLTHRMKHTDERPFTCDACDYRCRTKTNLISHQRSHTGERPFTCAECGRGFAIKSTLDQHLATHSEERPFQCDQCPFSTKYQSHLISHKRIHSGDVFHCQFAGCAYSSPKKSQLAAHLRTHLAVRAFQCGRCTRSFIEKSHLVRHERIHLQDKPFKCAACDYASSRRDKLKEHILKHHGATEEAAAAAVRDAGPSPAKRGPHTRPPRKHKRSKPLATLAHGPSTAGSLSGLSGGLSGGMSGGMSAPSVSSRSEEQEREDLASETSAAPDVAATFRPISTPPGGSMGGSGMGAVGMYAAGRQDDTLNTPQPTQPQPGPLPFDLAAMFAPSPAAVFSRPHSAFVGPGGSGGHALQPSPALSLNVSLENLAGAAGRVHKDVLLSTQLPPTPTLGLDVPGGPGGPLSPGSLQSEPFPSASTPSGDLQRPMSLPPPALPWPPSSQLSDPSFTAMW